MTAPVPPAMTPAVSPDRNDRRRLLIALVALIVVVLIGAVTAVVVLSGDDKAAASDVSLQSNLEPGPDPYTPNAATPTTSVPSSSSSSTSSVSSTTTQLSVPRASGAGVRSYVGGQPGLYGGTRDHHSCDPALMLEYLERNPSKLAAWASVEGIAVSEVRTYISSLTSVLLRTDTWVTNHGYANGHATTISSVLQAGTAVLLDSYGVPRVKCFCGNPLTTLDRHDYTPRYVGPRWAGFDSRTVVVIQQSTTIINNFTLVDPNTGDAFTRPVGSNGGHDGDASGKSSTSTTSTTGAPTSTAPPTSGTAPPTSSTAPPTSSTAPPTQPPTTPPPTQPPGALVAGPWNLSGRYKISAGGNTGSAGWDARIDVSSGGGVSGGGSGSAQVDGGCFNGTTHQKVADWHASLSFNVAVSGQSDGQGHFNLAIGKTSANLDGLTYSTEQPPEVADCRAQANAGYQKFVDDLLGSVTLDARPGATGGVGVMRGTVVVAR